MQEKVTAIAKSDIALVPVFMTEQTKSLIFPIKVPRRENLHNPIPFSSLTPQSLYHTEVQL